MDKMLYTVKQVAGIMHSNTNDVYALIRRGLLPAMKLGCYNVRAESLEKFLAESEGKDLTDLAAIKELPIEK